MIQQNSSSPKVEPYKLFTKADILTPKILKHCQAAKRKSALFYVLTKTESRTNSRPYNIPKLQNLSASN